jgi:hypothetical protein
MSRALVEYGRRQHVSIEVRRGDFPLWDGASGAGVFFVDAQDVMFDITLALILCLYCTTESLY